MHLKLTEFQFYLFQQVSTEYTNVTRGVLFFHYVVFTIGTGYQNGWWVLLFSRNDPIWVSTWVPIGGGPKKNLLRVKNEFA